MNHSVLLSDYTRVLCLQSIRRGTMATPAVRSTPRGLLVGIRGIAREKSRGVLRGGVGVCSGAISPS